MGIFPQHATTNAPHIASVATAFPPNVFTQKEVGELFGITNPVVQKLLAAPHIQTRHLMIDPEEVAARKGRESNADLHARFLRGLTTFGTDAARKALRGAGVKPQEIDIVVAVTSTGLPMPGFSAILLRDLGLRSNANRVDIVGMGCNAGMSAMRTLSTMLMGQRSAVGLLVCCEVSSAAYVNDGSTGNGVVNSLFGDGAAAIVMRGAAARLPSLRSMPDKLCPMVSLQDFESATLPAHYDDMMYEMPDGQDRLSFKLSKSIPFVVGDNVHVPVKTMLERQGLRVEDIAHWAIHTGGAAVIAGIQKNLGLSAEAVRHTVSVLSDYGNISSGSFLASFERLVEEHHRGTAPFKAGDRVVFIAMGPGATIEVGLGIVGMAL